MSTKAVFTTGSPMRHVMVMSFTSSLGLMAIFAVDLIDMIFIAMLGNAALAAAVGYAGTLMFFTTSISIGLSIGAGALTAKAIGAGDEIDAREVPTSVLMIGLVLSVLVAGLVLWQMTPLLSLLGASGETLGLARSYLTIILPSMPVMMGAMIASAVLRSHGDARRATMATLAAGITNAVLDPLFIFGLGMGLEGAAVASVCARVTMLVVALWPAIKVYNGFARPSLGIVQRDTGKVMAIAVPAVLANVATPVGAAIVTREMAKFGTDAVAGMAIIGRVTPVAFGVIFALSGAVGPIIGQNFGADLPQRVRATFYDALKFTAAFVAAIAIILFLLRGPIADMFGATGITRDLVFLFCGPLALVWIFNGWIFVGNAAFNNLGHPYYSTWINWGRSTIGLYPFVLLGAWAFGAPGVLIGQAAGGVIFAIISLYLAHRLLDAKPADKDDPHEFVPYQRRHALEARHR